LRSLIRVSLSPSSQVFVFGVRVWCFPKEDSGWQQATTTHFTAIASPRCLTPALQRQQFLCCSSLLTCYTITAPPTHEIKTSMAGESRRATEMSMEDDDDIYDTNAQPPPAPLVGIAPIRIEWRKLTAVCDAVCCVGAQAHQTFVLHQRRSQTDVVERGQANPRMSLFHQCCQ
jgi:hypothetical protein